MLRLLAGLTRSLPLMIALVVLAIVVYLIISWIKSPMKAKEILIKLFLVLCSAIAIFFVLASIYALVDDNVAVFELAASCAFVGVVGLVITLICRYLFIKHNPHYRYKRTADGKTQTGEQTIEDVPMRGRSAFWMIYDLLGHFRPKR